MTESAVERLSPVGADVKSLRREAKRGYALALDDAVKAEPATESPRKKHMPEKSKSKSKSGAAAPASAAAKKKAAARHHEVTELQGVVDGIQQQVDAASRGIEELKQLVHSHLLGHVAPHDGAVETAALSAPACVSPPASLMALDDQEDDDHELSEFPAYFHSDTLVYYGAEPMPFSC